MKTFSVKPDEVEKQWYVIDAKGKHLGRMATEIAVLLRGKHKPIFTPHIDSGDNVIVINASEVTVTGKKFLQKKYYRHSGYPGGFKELTFEQQMQKDPRKVVEFAVWGMLPKTRLGRQQIRKLHIYAGMDHPHSAQQPKVHEINN